MPRINIRDAAWYCASALLPERVYRWAHDRAEERRWGKQVPTIQEIRRDVVRELYGVELPPERGTDLEGGPS